MNERLKELRKALNLTQTEFGERLSVTVAQVSKMELGERNITERTIKDVCREFSVHPAWLLDGVGEMFVDNESEIDNVIDLLMADENETARATFKALARLGKEEWALFDKTIRAIAKELGV